MRGGGIARAFAAATAVAACSPAEDAAPRAVTSAAASAAGPTTTSSPVPREVDARFVFASATRARAEPPARYARPLPHDLDHGYRATEEAPPAHYVSGLLCASDEPMTRQLVEATRRSVESGGDVNRVASTVAGLVRLCDPTPAYCRAAAERAARATDGAERLVAATTLAECGRPGDLELFERRDVPALAVFHYLAARRLAGPKPLFTERVGRAAIELAKSLDDAQELRMAGRTLAAFDDRNAVLALFAMRDVTKRHARTVALTGMLSHDPEARRMGEEACAEVPTDPLCVRDDDPELRLPKAAREDLGHPERITMARLARFVTDPHVRRSVGPKLEACARPSRTAFDCIIRLQLVDRKRASELARKLKPRATFLEREQVAALARFETGAALEAHLVGLGFRPAREAKDGELRTYARELLDASGHLSRFDVETNRFPNEHDALLIELARLAKEDLGGVLFEERPPAKGAPSPYELCAYRGGDRWCTTAKNLGDWYDLEAVLGLLNTVARDSGKRTRFASLATTDQLATVLAGPASGITSLADSGLVELAPADAAREKGVAAEVDLTSSKPGPRR